MVYDEDGEYVATVYPARGLRETTWIETSCAGGRLRGVAETVQQPTLEVDIEVEGNLVPPAVAGHFTFPKPDGCAGALKNYTYAIDNPDPEPDTPTELIAVTAVPHEGFNVVRWTGAGPVYDEDGVERTDVALDATEDEPDRWVTGETIYIKCLDYLAEDVTKSTTKSSIKEKEPRSKEIKVTVANTAELWVFIDQPGNGGDRDSYEGADTGHCAWMLSVPQEVIAVFEEYHPDYVQYLNRPMGFFPILGLLDMSHLINHGGDVNGEFKLDSSVSEMDVCARFEWDSEKDLFGFLKWCDSQWVSSQWRELKYNLYNYNCAHAAYEAVQKFGVRLPFDQVGELVHDGEVPRLQDPQEGYSPGLFGEDLKAHGLNCDCP